MNDLKKFVQNPQFVLKADEPTRAVILLTQTAKKEFDTIGFYIFETKSIDTFFLYVLLCYGLSTLSFSVSSQGVKSKLTNITPKDIIAKSEFTRTTEGGLFFERFFDFITVSF
jgi:hypothetical protein